MTPDLLLAGGVSQEEPEIVSPEGQALRARLSYQPIAHSDSPTSFYEVKVTPRSLHVAVRRTERGWVATTADLNSLGYGDTPEQAVEDMLDAVAQYLEFVRDDQPPLAPSVAHHSAYVSLLEAPRAAWLASVMVDAAPVE